MIAPDTLPFWFVVVVNVTAWPALFALRLREFRTG